MILVPIPIYSQFIRSAKPEFWHGILPQSGCLGPDRLVLSAKHTGKRGSRDWHLWVISPGRTKTTPYLGALHGWLWPQLPAFSLNVQGEGSIYPHFAVHAALGLRQAWVVLGPDQLGPDNCLLYSANGSDLKRVWFLTTDQLDGLEPGIDRCSIAPKARTFLCWPKPDELVDYPCVGQQARLCHVAENERQRMIDHYYIRTKSKRCPI